MLTGRYQFVMHQHQDVLSCFWDRPSIAEDSVLALYRAIPTEVIIQDWPFHVVDTLRGKTYQQKEFLMLGIRLARDAAIQRLQKRGLLR